MLYPTIILKRSFSIFLYSTLAEANFKRTTTKTLTQPYIEMLLLTNARHDIILFLPLYTFHSIKFSCLAIPYFTSLYLRQL